MDILRVQNLCKRYAGFRLQDVSFSLPRGSIMGFIGRNGAGKTTTLKAVMNMVQPDSGTVFLFEQNSSEQERLLKQRIGYAGGAVDYYKRRKIATLLAVTKRFYPSWDDALCQKYMRLFSLDENKTPAQLSEGMRVKLSLVLALSHGAELLILDEPTSGLDPVSRQELLEIFRYLKAQGISILFSTHIISDIEHCADTLTYIRQGRVVYTGELAAFTQGENLEQVMLHYESEALHEEFAL